MFIKYTETDGVDITKSVAKKVTQTRADNMNFKAMDALQSCS